LDALQEIFIQHKNDQMVVMMHHPLFSNGEHGGNFPVTDHLFPFRILNSKLWIPLPIVGSVLPVVRMLGGVKQDIPHKQYQQLKNGILAGGDARMVRSAMGYSVVHFYKDGSAWLDFYIVDKNQPNGELIYRKKIIQ